jgi:hypothetical protein
MRKVADKEGVVVTMIRATKKKPQILHWDNRRDALRTLRNEAEVTQGRLQGVKG